MMRRALGLAVGVAHGVGGIAGGAASLGLNAASRSMGGEPLFDPTMHLNRGLQGLLTRGALTVGAISGVVAGVNSVRDKYTVTRSVDGNLEPVSDGMLGASGSMAFAMHKRASRR